MMTRACLAFAFFCLLLAMPLQAFDWETATVRGREYVTLKSFCLFYGFHYDAPSSDRYTARGPAHTLSLKVGNADMYLDGVHYVMSFPIEAGDHDWLISRMDVIKLFEPVLRPNAISGRHTIRGVVIDAGHGGTDNGAVSINHDGTEKRYTLDTAFRLEALLNDAGLKTVLTRRSDVFIDLYERAHIASLYPDYCFVSIHYNSASEEAHGLETYCLAPSGAASTSSAYLTRGDIQKLPGNDDDTMNIELASQVHSEITKLNSGDSSADRGVKRARFVVIKMNLIPAILVEGGFLSNYSEARRVDHADYRQRLAEAIARGVIHFANVMGDRHLSLPESEGNTANDDAGSGKPPRATAVTPANAPAGLAKDATGVKGKSKTDKSQTGSTPGATKTASSDGTVTPPGTNPTTPKTTKPKKPKKTPATTKTLAPATPPTSAPAPTPSPEDEPGAAPTPTPAPAHAPESSKSTQPATSPAPGIINVPADDSPAKTSPAPATPTSPPAPAAGADKASDEPDEPPTVNIYPTPSATPSKSSAPASTNAAPQAPATPHP